jgi:TPR repeat protein
MITRQFLRELIRATFSRSWVPKRNVAAMYALGEGVAKNEVRARRWYVRAARAGDESALTDLGMMHIYGEGGPVDYARGRVLILEAAELGDGTAQKLLAHFFLEGMYGFPVNREKAEHWRDLARAQGMQV